MDKFFRRGEKKPRDFEKTESGDIGYDSVECRICPSYDSKVTGKLVISSHSWDFYYCYRCKNWFKIADRDRDTFYPVKEENKIRALNAYYTSCLQELEVMEEATGLIHGILGSIGRLIYRLITRRV